VDLGQGERVEVALDLKHILAAVVGIDDRIERNTGVADSKRPAFDAADWLGNCAY
jgi:hypothetical protein